MERHYHSTAHFKFDLNAVVTETPPTPYSFTIETYAERIALRYEAKLMVINGGGEPAEKAERFAREYETQLTLLAEYADLGGD